jgi:tetratricopeptide (TPR) repeat protein
MGRVFSLVFHGFLNVASPAVAVNLLSAIPSAIAAVLLYLCVVRIGKRLWNDGVQSTTCFPAIVAGLTAGLFAAFASTLWIDSIEAEVYAVSGMWTVFTAWLALVWADSEPKDERLLVVIAYLLSLNIGVHLATYLAALAILPFAYLYEKRLAIPVSFVVVLTMAKDLQFFLLVVALLLLPTLQFAILPTEYGKRHRTNLLVAHVTALVLALWAVNGLQPSTFRHVLVFGAPIAAFLLPWIALPAPKKLENPFHDLGFLLAAVTVIGFSCHLYLPIRSVLNPAINEAQPDTWARFWDMILRAQYRPVSVLERQAPWVSQFDHMFWRYFREQWSPALLTLIGIPGLIAHWKKDKKSFVLFALLFLWSSAALVFKMNFTDHEVRERDYFFAPGFFYYAVWMGLGLGWLASLVVAGLRGTSRRAAMAGTAVLCVAIAAVPIRSHWRDHDRRGNWVAHDYAYNMLVGLEPNAILFTNGDNDTFPVWYLQEVKGFRKDVRIVNLSLLNTPWYGDQLRNEEPRVPMTFTTEQLYEDIRPVRTEEGKVLYVKDIVATDIVNAAYEQGSERPIYFAVTVEDLMDLDDYLKLEGLVFRLTPDSPVTESLLTPSDSSEVATDRNPVVLADVNLRATRHNLEELYQYRGLLTEDGQLDPTVYRDSNDGKLVTNYAAAWARLALAYRKVKNWDESVACIKRAVAISPNYEPIVGSMGSFLLESKRYDEARAYYTKRVETQPSDLRSYLGLAFLAQRDGHLEEALEWYLRALRFDPADRDVLAGLYQTYYGLGRYEEAKAVIQRWIQMNPSDGSARELLEDLQRQIEIGGVQPGSKTRE